MSPATCSGALANSWPILGPAVAAGFALGVLFWRRVTRQAQGNALLRSAEDLARNVTAAEWHRLRPAADRSIRRKGKAAGNQRLAVQGNRGPLLTFRDGNHFAIRHTPH